MGKNQSKGVVQIPETSASRVMKRKYGEECLLCLPLWCSHYGFPDGGSLSLNQLGKLRERLQQEKGQMMKAKTVSTRSFKLMEAHEKCLRVWEEAARERDRKWCPKEMARAGSAENAKVIQGNPGAKAQTNTNGSPKATKVSHSHPQNASLQVLPLELGACSGQEKQVVFIMEPAGASFVHRLYSSEDVARAATLLPDPVTDGAEFSEEFQAFCDEFRPSGLEIKRLLSVKLKPSDFAKISASLLASDVRPLSAKKDDNADYNDKVKALGEAIAAAFPRESDVSKVSACKQGPGESTDEFIQRMAKIFSVHSGLKCPSVTYEYHLCHAIVRGLLPEVVQEVRRNHGRVLEEPTLEELKRHCRHAYDVLTEKKRRQMETRDLRKALRKFYASAGQRGRHDYFWGRDECYRCGRPGHWARDCPDADFPPQNRGSR